MEGKIIFKELREIGMLVDRVFFILKDVGRFIESYLVIEFVEFEDYIIAYDDI